MPLHHQQGRLVDFPLSAGLPIGFLSPGRILCRDLIEPGSPALPVLCRQVADGADATPAGQPFDYAGEILRVGLSIPSA